MQLIPVTNGDRILIISVLPEAIASATVSSTITKAPGRILIVLFQNTSRHLRKRIVLT
ncbi:MAG: hypothetical protein V7L27_08840 [Nostoc sp.]|uniref:hypothetical protein n=1 Tax=Nostoc sp. TaxID=1180 RepID=UPI002FFB953F